MWHLPCASSTSGFVGISSFFMIACHNFFAIDIGGVAAQLAVATSAETRTVKLWLPTVEVTRTATGWRCCCCLYGFCTSFILEGGLAAVSIAVAVAAASQLTLANGNGVNVATVAAATVPATTPATTAATATVAATAAANERELNLGDLTLSIYLGHGCCLLSCVRCSGAAEQREGGLFEPAEMYW